MFCLLGLGQFGLTIFLVLFWIFVLLPIYFVPSYIAFKKQKLQKTAIVVLNVFLGWTFLGWVVALVWACMEDGTNAAENRQDYSPEKITKKMIFSMLFIRKSNETKIYGPVSIEKITEGLSLGKLSPDDFYSETRQGVWQPLSQLTGLCDDDDFFDDIKAGVKVAKNQAENDKTFGTTNSQSYAKYLLSLTNFSKIELPRVNRELKSIFIASTLSWFPLIFIFPEMWPLSALFTLLLFLSWVQFGLLEGVSENLATFAVFTILSAVGNGVMLCLCLLQYYVKITPVSGVTSIPDSAFYITLFWQVICYGIIIKTVLDNLISSLTATFYYWMTQILLVLWLINFSIPRESSYLMKALAGRPVEVSSNHLLSGLDANDVAKAFAGKWIIVFEPKRLPNGEANQNEFEIQFDFHQRLGKDYLFRHLSKRPPQLWQTNVVHGTWNIKKIKRNDDGTYSMNLNLYANRNIEEITLVVDKLTRHSFEAYLETNPSLNFQANRR